MRPEFVVVALALVWCPKIHAAEPSPSTALAVDGEFHFLEASPAYSARLSGEVSLRLVRSGDDRFVAELPVVRGLPQGLSGLFLRFFDDDPKTIDAPEWPLYLTRENTGAEELDDWVSGKKAPDPSLNVHLVPRYGDPREQTNAEPVPPPENGALLLTNPRAVVARAFLMRCGNDGSRFVPYAKLGIPANALLVKLPEPNSPESSFVVTSARLTGIAKRTWRKELRCIDPEGNFGSVADGWSQGIEGVVVPPHDVPTIGGAVAAFSRATDGLVREMRVGEDFFRAIVPSLLEISALPTDPERSADPISRMETIREMLDLLDPDAADALRGAADRTLEALVGLPLDVDPPLPRPCDPPVEIACPCRPVYVSSRAKRFSGLPDGTLERPFRTIGSALEAVQHVDECVPEIRIGQGSYRENVALSFDVVLRARAGHAPVLFGSMTIADPVNVVVSGLSFVDSDGLAAITVLNRCASLRLEDVRIDRAARFGVRQSGGRLVMVRSRVLRTRRLGGDNAHGTAVLIERGAQATLNGIALLENEGPAILVQGAETHVLAESTLIAENRIRRLVDDPPCGVIDAIAAVEVRRDAGMEMQHCWLIRNQFVGLLATTGGSIRFRRGIVQETLAPDWHTSSCYGGIGAVAGYGGRIHLSEFRASRNDLCGLQVLEDGELDATDGVIERNPIGTSVLREVYDFDRVTVSVLYVDNDRNIDAAVLPIPDPALP